jgi:phospholipase/carboxylesterase
MKKLFFCFIGAICTLAGISQTVNTRLSYLVNEPAKRTPKTPVLIILHGYGSNEEDPVAMAKALDPRFITFSLRAPNTTPVGGYCWYPMEFLPDKSFKYDYEKVKESKALVLSFISNACKAFKVDSTQVYLMGFSQGAIMSYELAVSHPEKFKGVLALSGRMMPETKTMKTDWNKVAALKFFIAHGNSDNVIPITEGYIAHDFLKEKKVADLTFKNYEMPHTITGNELNDIKSWLLNAISPEKKKGAAK